MKYLLIICLLLISCNKEPKKNLSKDKAVLMKNKVIENTTILRKSGFFKNYEKLSNTEIFKKLHSIRKIEYSKLFEKEHDPGMELDEFDLACLDDTKVIFIDLEAGVCKENKVYEEVINLHSKLTDYVFNPKNIKETWNSETGSIEVEFELDKKKINFKPEFRDDWLDEIVFRICKEKIKEKNIRIVDCLGDDGYGFGQSIAIMRLTKEEQENLEKQFKWKFAE
ncbi:hypothetical protein OIU83_13680 [Flavobacterium sp. LS1R49]|uniref:Uncharacterized protein n=1 Tax=Flavobacterium shii TaxID=2987687 RepID=A0A9X2ZDQ4_9FLAO|nr:hypothetical protein [Flavobacterium shii]MCV9928715.1 hypothetical protein [Flavobacterium shii]